MEDGGPVYQLGELIGKGAFSSVYLALNLESGETVAVKEVPLARLLAPSQHAHPHARAAPVLVEMELWKQLHHPNIIRYLGCKPTEDGQYLRIYMEFGEGGSLLRAMRRFGQFPEALVAVYIRQVLQGLQYLHKQGTIHRDIKAGNIVCTKTGVVKLADFGISTRVGASDDFCGSPYWMAPEVIELAGASTASDIWSVGCTTIELLQGSPPYYELTPMSALFCIVTDKHPPYPPGISAGLRDFLDQCFQKNPAQRISAALLLQHPWLRAAGVLVASAPSPLADLHRRPSAPVEAACNPGVPGLGNIYAGLLNPTKAPKEFSANPPCMPSSGKVDAPPPRPSLGEHTYRRQLSDVTLTEEEEVRLSRNSEEPAQGKARRVCGPEADACRVDGHGFASVQVVHEACRRLLASPPGAESVMQTNCDNLLVAFVDDPALARVLVTHHHLQPLLSLLQRAKSAAACHLLAVLERAIRGSFEVAERLCMLGGLPMIIEHAEAGREPAIRRIATRCLHTLCQSGPVVLQMFLACRGAEMLVRLLHLPQGPFILDEAQGGDFEVADITQDCILLVLGLKTPSLLEDIGHLLIGHHILVRLAELLQYLQSESSSCSPSHSSLRAKVHRVLLLLSQGSDSAKEQLAKSKCMRVICQEAHLPGAGNEVPDLLTCVRNVATLPSTLDGLEQAGAVEWLVGLLRRSGVREGDAQCDPILHALLHLCRMSKRRQTRAASAGIIPSLQYAAQGSSGARTHAVPLLCAMVHAGPGCRALLLRHGVLDSYLLLMPAPDWQASALDSICCWLREDFVRVHPLLCRPRSMAALLGVCGALSPGNMSVGLGLFAQILAQSPALSWGAARLSLIMTLVQVFGNPDAEVRVHVLCILTSIIKALGERGPLLISLRPFIVDVHQRDPAICVREAAHHLLCLLAGPSSRTIKHHE